MGKGLSDKQELFCREYLLDLNATQACIRAGYSKKTACEQGSQHLSKLNIQARIQQLMKNRSDRTEITSDKVLNELAKIAFSNIQDFTDNTNGVVNINGLEPNVTAAVSSIEVMSSSVGEESSIKISKLKLHDKLRALEQIGKHLGMFEKDNAQKQPIIAPNIILSKK